MLTIVNHGLGRLNLRFGVSLAPGSNEIDAEAWQLCRDDPITKHYLSTRQVQVVPSPNSGTHSPLARVDPAAAPVAGLGTTPPKQKQKPLTKLKAKEAITIVSQWADVQNLKETLAVETRPTVRAAIERRIENLRA